MQKSATLLFDCWNLQETEILDSGISTSSVVYCSLSVTAFTIIFKYSTTTIEIWSFPKSVDSHLCNMCILQNMFLPQQWYSLRSPNLRKGSYPYMNHECTVIVELRFDYCSHSPYVVEINHLLWHCILFLEFLHLHMVDIMSFNVQVSHRASLGKT